jgi:hypothetical protein
MRCLIGKEDAYGSSRISVAPKTTRSKPRRTCVLPSPIPIRTVISVSSVLHDVAKATALWSNEAQAWWPKGPNDPEVRVVRVIPDNAEYWATRGNSIVVALKLIAAQVSGHPPDLGEDRNAVLRNSGFLAPSE